MYWYQRPDSARARQLTRAQETIAPLRFIYSRTNDSTFGDAQTKVLTCRYRRQTMISRRGEWLGLRRPLRRGFLEREIKDAKSHSWRHGKNAYFENCKSPPHCSMKFLAKWRIANGRTTQKPRTGATNGVRMLHIGSDTVQGNASRRPNDLELSYTRSMMAFFFSCRLPEAC